MRKEENQIKITYKPSLLIVLGIILVLTMIAQLTFLSMFGTRGKDVANIRQEQKELILENELLEAEINEYQSLLHVREVATEELGMIAVPEIEYITVNETVSSNNQ